MSNQMVMQASMLSVVESLSTNNPLPRALRYFAVGIVQFLTVRMEFAKPQYFLSKSNLQLRVFEEVIKLYLEVGLLENST